MTITSSPPRACLSLRVLARLLSYPDAGLRNHISEMRDALHAERAITVGRLVELDALMDALSSADPLDAEAAYVQLFDRGRATSLHLFEHVHGDSRDRGQAMVDLAQIYARGGLDLSTRELPDYLPVLLEYLSTRPFAEVEEMLRDCAHLLRSIGEALVRRDSGYAVVLATLLAVAGESQGLGSSGGGEVLPNEKSLDEEWAEEPVLFGLGCGDARSASSPQPIRFVRKVA
jgi:nitrate reductase molybdenum cofactor assembly chaperone NarJ/NarW